MIFSSAVFIFVFLPIVLLGFHLLLRLPSRRAPVIWLIAASIFFYGWWNPVYLLLIVPLIIANYVLGRLIFAAPSTQLRKLYLQAGIVLNLGTLVYYKYAGFLVENINLVAGTTFDIGLIVLPLGISFFTFQKIAFLVDTYKGRVGRVSLADYSLFVLFFPQLIAGPIVHHAEIVPQFKDLHKQSAVWDNLTVGICVFLIGLFKKIVFADSLSAYAVAPVFSAAAAGESLTFLEAWIGVLGYTLQLYFDFSGYSDMAIGAGRMFGIRLPENFFSPYKSANIIDFWRRWHITLGRFLRDYLYIALGGNRNGNAKRYINLFLTMLIGGIWHGAGWTFVVWGALHGSYLMINHAWRAVKGRLFPGHRQPSSRTATVFSIGLTFLAVMIGWTFFRADSVASAMTILHAMFGGNGMVLPDSITVVPLLGALLSPFAEFESTRAALGNIKDPVTVAYVVALLAWCWALPNAQQIFRPYQIALSSDDSLPRWRSLLFRYSWTWAAAAGLVFAICLMYLQSNIAQEFLYFDF
jgi:D-alanyl-lipoteichoic acid acyltransferase DltB (MBOAT superfamily)